VFCLLYRLCGLKIKLKDDAKSFVWQSFGQLLDSSNKRIHDDKIFCLHCFNGGTGKLKAYKESVSTTNLAQHLREAHGILF